MPGSRDYFVLTPAESSDVVYIHNFLRPINGIVCVSSFTIFKAWTGRTILSRPGVCYCVLEFFICLWRIFSFLTRRAPIWGGFSAESLLPFYPSDVILYSHGIYTHFIRFTFGCDSCLSQCRVFSSRFRDFFNGCLFDLQRYSIRFVLLDPSLQNFAPFELCSVLMSSIVSILHRFNVGSRGTLLYCPLSDFNAFSSDVRFISIINSFRAFFGGDVQFSFDSPDGRPRISLNVQSPLPSIVAGRRRLAYRLFRHVTPALEMTPSPTFSRPLAELYLCSGPPSDVLDGLPIYSPGSTSGSVSPHFQFPPTEGSDPELSPDELPSVD